MRFWLNKTIFDDATDALEANKSRWFWQVMCVRLNSVALEIVDWEDLPRKSFGAVSSIFVCRRCHFEKNDRFASVPSLWNTLSPRSGRNDGKKVRKEEWAKWHWKICPIVYSAIVDSRPKILMSDFGNTRDDFPQKLPFRTECWMIYGLFRLAPHCDPALLPNGARGWDECATATIIIQTHWVIRTASHKVGNTKSNKLSRDEIL